MHVVLSSSFWSPVSPLNIMDSSQFSDWEGSLSLTPSVPLAPPFYLCPCEHPRNTPALSSERPLASDLSFIHTAAKDPFPRGSGQSAEGNPWASGPSAVLPGLSSGEGGYENAWGCWDGVCFLFRFLLLDLAC